MICLLVGFEPNTSIFINTMRQLIAYLLIIFWMPLFSQESESQTLLIIENSDDYRIKKVRLIADEVFESEKTDESYLLFEFPKDTTTLLLFADLIININE